MRAVVDVLDGGGGMAQAGGAGAGLEAFLPPQRRLLLEQQPKPLGVIEGARFRIGAQFLEAFGHAVQAKLMKQIECRVDEHEDLRQWK